MRWCLIKLYDDGGDGDDNDDDDDGDDDGNDDDDDDDHNDDDDDDDDCSERNWDVRSHMSQYMLCHQMFHVLYFCYIAEVSGDDIWTQGEIVPLDMRADSYAA